MFIQNKYNQFCVQLGLGNPIINKFFNTAHQHGGKCQPMEYVIFTFSPTLFIEFLEMEILYAPTGQVKYTYPPRNLPVLQLGV